MKLSFAILFMISVLFCLTSCFFGPSLIFTDRDAVGKPNLVTNPDFENPQSPDNEYPDNWMFISTEDYKDVLAWDSYTIHSGKRSLRIDNPTQVLLLVSESFPIDSKSAYLNRCYVKSKKPSLSPVILSFRSFDNMGARKDNFTSRLMTTSDWQEIMLSTGFFKSSALFGRIIIYIPIDPDNTYWIDDIGSYHVHTFTR